MADTSSLTFEGYGEIGKLICDGDSSKMTKIALIGDTSFTANEAAKYASLTIIAGNGLGIAAGSLSVSVSAAAPTTATINKTFTNASTGDEIFGFAAVNDDANIAFATMKFDPTVSITPSDTISCQLILTVDEK